ncbi:MAG: hypothetical protein M3501_03190 [Actinomycetota bacterium]|nr:hypothetical protein [Actinomycetota bacterium]MDQ3350954.1 hypothetical protein [Actinomycetota bacterium]
MDTTVDLREVGGANAFLSNCASRTMLAAIANKWTCYGMVSRTDAAAGDDGARSDAKRSYTMTRRWRRLAMVSGC